MAKYIVPNDDIGASEKKAVANTVDEVEYADTLRAVEVTSDRAAALDFTVGGSTPTVGGTNCHHMPAIAGVRTVVVPTS